jgi:hypothetical protein
MYTPKNFATGVFSERRSVSKSQKAVLTAPASVMRQCDLDFIATVWVDEMTQQDG